MGYPLRASALYVLVAYPEKYIDPMPTTGTDMLAALREALTVRRNGQNGEAYYLLTNTFLTEWDTPYGIPDFSQIKEKHYVPAVEVGIRQQQSEIDAIIAESDAPTFENVVEAYERSGAILDRVTSVLFNVSEADATESALRCVVAELVFNVG